jgi:hypothetical protein
LNTRSTRRFNAPQDADAGEHRWPVMFGNAISERITWHGAVTVSKSRLEPFLGFDGDRKQLLPPWIVIIKH